MVRTTRLNGASNVVNTRTMKVNSITVSLLALAVAALAGAPRPLRAQSSTGADLGTDLETRPALVAEAKRAEAQHRTGEAWLLNQRLQKGDFQDGDKILVKLLGPVQLSQNPGMDTLTVRAGRMLPIPNMADLPLEGVLRSELETRLSSHLAKYLRDSAVKVIPLLRLGVLGQVRNPGYFSVPADILINDLVMKSGGPAPGADVGNMVIRRGGEVIWNAQDTRTALADGISLERLHLRAGDDLYVDDTKANGIDWKMIGSILGPVVGLLFGLRQLLR